MNRHLRLGCAATAAVAGLCIGSAWGQGPDVAIIAAADSVFGTCLYTDPFNKLQNSGAFNSVTLIDLNTTTPTLVELMAFDAVMTWTNSTPQNTNAWGDVLADYVDAGGGVVVTVFANSTITANRDIGGRWRNNPVYEVIVPRSGNQSSATSLGAILDPTHPTVDGLTAFNCTLCFRASTMSVTPGSSIIAQWADGRILVAVGSNPKRVDLGFFPPSSVCNGAYWTGDGDRLLVNAMLVASGAGKTCYPDCDTSTGPGVLDIFDFLCFGNRFSANDPYACDCDVSTGPGVCDIFDFLCFGNAFNAGCP